MYDIKSTATYFPRVKTQVSSAGMCLTVVFGMGTGVSTYHEPSTQHHTLLNIKEIYFIVLNIYYYRLVNANGDVLIADCECYQADRAISTGQLNILLCLHLLPINAVVYCDPNWEVLF